MKKLTENRTSIVVGTKLLPKLGGRDEYLQPVTVTAVTNQGTSREIYNVQDALGKTHVINYREFALVPEIGMPVTFSCHSDQYPGTVVAVSKSGKSITVREEEYKYAGLPGEGGPGGKTANEWEYYENPQGRLITFRRNKRGDWQCGSYHAGIGWRRYYYNYEF